MPLLYPTLYQTEKTSATTDVFLGLNRGVRIADGEFYDMQNLSSDEAPVLVTRKKRGIPVYEGVQSPQHITTRATGEQGDYEAVFIDGSMLWLGNTKKVDLSPFGYVANGDKQIVAMGAYLIVLPDMIYVNTVNTDDKGVIRDKATVSGYTVTMTVCDYEGNSPNINAVGASPPSNPKNGDMWLDTKVSGSPVLKKYGEADGAWYKIEPYIVVSGIDLGGTNRIMKITNKSRLAAGDVVFISGDSRLSAIFGQKKIMNVGEVVGDDKSVSSFVVSGIIDSVMTQISNVSELTVERFIPRMDYVCEAGNRLWGCRYGDDGHGNFVNEIYCSARGDFYRWGLGAVDNDDAPVSFSIGTDGAWTGAVNYNGYPTFFKERMMHRVSGYTASGFSLYDTPCMGVARGAHKSLAVVENILYYKSPGPVMAFDGTTPVVVSDPLGKLTGFTEAVGGGCGEKYYLALGKSGAERHIYVLDTKKGLWHREDDTEVESMASAGDNLWMITVKRRNGGKDIDRKIMTVEPVEGATASEVDNTPIRWYAETGTIGLETTSARYLDKIIMKVWMDAGSSLRVLAQYDSNGVWKQILATEAPTLKTIPMTILPVRCDHMRIRLEGIGACKVFSMTKIYERADER